MPAGEFAGKALVWENTSEYKRMRTGTLQIEAEV